MLDQASQGRVQTFCLMALTAAVIAYSIFWLRPVLLPFVVALFIVSGLAPLLSFLQRNLRVNQLVAAGIAFLMGIVVLFLLGWMLRLSVLDLAQYGPAYRKQMQTIVKRLERSFPTLSQANSTDPQQADSTPTDPTPGGRDLSEQQISADPALLTDQLLRDGLSRLSQALLELFSSGAVVLIYVFFLLLGASDVAAPNPTLQEIDQQIRSYLSLKSVISLLTGAAFGFVLWLFGVPLALTLGLLAFLLNYIPNIGPLIASLLPIPW